MRHTRLTTLAATMIASTLAVAAVAAADEDKVAADDSMAKAENPNPGMNQNMTDKNAMKHPVVVLVPVAFASDKALADGCWARLYDSENFKGGALTLVGSVDVPSTSPASVTGYEFGRNYGSVVVGPNAVLHVWDNENYQDKNAKFQSGQRVPELDDRMGFFGEIKSMKVACSK